MSQRPGIEDLTGDHEIATLARETWLANNPSGSHAVPKLFKLLQESDFKRWDLLLLEQLQALERYLWPGFTKDAANQHVLLLVLLVNIKRQEHLPTWSIFTGRPDEFTDFFGRVTHLSVDPSITISLRTHILEFIVAAYQSLDQTLVRRECASLLTIGIWQNLHSAAARDRLLAKNVQLQKAWRTAGKKYDGADAADQARLRFERSWLNALLMSFLDKLYDVGDQRKPNLPFCERVLELLCDMQSQLPTRRYVNTLIQDLNLIPAIALSPMYRAEDSLRAMFELFKHYTYFPVDDQTGRQLSRKEHEAAQNDSIWRLQKVAMKLQPEKLKILTLTNFGSLSRPEELQSHMDDLTDAELVELCQGIGLRTSEYPEKSLLIRDRDFTVQSLVSLVEARPLYTEKMRQLPILPTEKSLYDPSVLHTDNYDGTRPLAIPKLNLQYLTVGDFLWRSFTLSRLESYYEIRNHLQDTIKRLQPRKGGGITRFDGFSRMAIPISRPAIIETLPSRVGETVPAEVKIEIILDVSRLQPSLRREWEDLKSDDTLFLLALHPLDTKALPATNGNSKHTYAEEIGLQAVRCAAVTSVLDDNGKMLRRHTQNDSEDMSRPRQRRLLLRLDAAAYAEDKKRTDAGHGDVYESVNLIVRRKGRENNFRSVLESIRQLALSDAPIPAWLQEVFLGVGDPSSAVYKRLATRLKSIDYRDTFLDWQHLIESLPGKTVEPDPTQDGSFPPPYVLESNDAAPPPAPPKNKKRRRDQEDGEGSAATAETLKVSTYKPPNTGPYPTDAPKLNNVRFTPTQIEAVTSGTQPGLTIIVGPPGTGKTDVATQIINNIYHQFPQQRTLLIAHSNQALNQLFQKIVALDIDERHLLRLGHGEEDLNTDSSFSKAGRVESFLERGSHYLGEVQRLAYSIAAPGAHGSSCETAEYFNQVWIQPRWTRFWDVFSSEESDTIAIIGAFPFHDYFSNAPQPLFSPQASKSELGEIAKGCERHIRRIFDELADIRPFEILRAQRDKSNYLLVKEARIIAMTSTHAAMRRQEIAGLGFHYDNVIMEEAAQVTEIENFIPFVMQQPRMENGKPPESQLQRIVLVGDHLQNSPIVQNHALAAHSHLDQSLFQRLIRLGVPHILLDAQGRSRPSLAALYKWRYPNLTNLPFTSTEPRFIRANPGFRYEYQFIDVGDYKGQGETSPSPHTIQNLGEAEYAVAIYQYMRLLGYPASKISILTAYAGQRALIRDVLAHRCKNNRLFGLPAWVGTVDKYQGEQNDYVILSLVRTKTPGYLRDLRRITVALSRARLGLYVLGRKAVFESSLELRDAFELLFERSSEQLALVPAESFANTTRTLQTDIGEGGTLQIADVQRMGEHVFQLTKQRVEDLKTGKSVLAPVEEEPAIQVEAAESEEDDDDVEDGEGEEVFDEDEDIGVEGGA